MSKALLIQSDMQIGTGTQGIWNPLTQATSYIKGIKTNAINNGQMNSETINSLVSGVPSPWARAKMFKYALDTLSNSNVNNTGNGLIAYYQILCGEWKGLLAVMALYSDRITISKPVYMNTKGLGYDIASAFGRMLFDDKDVWSNQQSLEKDPDAQPFIHLIYYNGSLVGGTSPLTGVFTGVSYNNLDNVSDIPWYRNGVFEDPIKHLLPEQLQKLYLFIKNINSKLATFEKNINSQRNGKEQIDLKGFKDICQKFEKEIKAASSSGLSDSGPIARYDNLQFPFSDLFKNEVAIYLKDDYTLSYTNDGQSKLIGDIQDLLSSDKHVLGWVESSNEKNNLSDAPVYFLQVGDIKTGNKFYFSLPLSETGIEVFGKSLSSILGDSHNSNVSMSARTEDGTTLIVSFAIEIDGKPVNLNDKEYKIDWVTSQGKVIIWPNFVSDNWKNYYFFSEFTSDAGQQFTPIFRSQGEIVKNDKNDFVTLDNLSTSGNLVQVKPLVTYKASGSDGLPKYNIIRSDKQICGVRCMSKDNGNIQGAGFLLTRNDIIKEESGIIQKRATIGFDFGSNNTCVFYNSGNGAEPVKFDNYRAVLVGRENSDYRAVAEPNELLFFTNYKSENGQIKSWIHEHEKSYVMNTQTDEIGGGVPVNRPNIRVKKIDEYKIDTQAGVLHYNMKWLDNDEGKRMKQAYMKSVWLQICAYLFKEHISPETVEWSYPGSMMEYDINDLSMIFENMVKLKPYSMNVSYGYGVTEAEAVCRYALSQDFGLSGDNMFLGIDVGGSTSDILLLAQNPKNRNKETLFGESSVRIASGVFFNAINQSAQFQDAVLNFHEGHNTDVYVANIKDMQNDKLLAGHYLNSIFDQLKSVDDYDMFYSSMSDHAKFVFTMPAYVCGLLLFYSGMLIGKAIKDNELTNITNVNLMPFGKGGRIFHWLKSAVTDRTTKSYYSECLNAGVKIILPEKDIKVVYKDENTIKENTKTEVARGLCEHPDIVNIDKKNNVDICGETGVSYKTKDGETKLLNVDDELEGSMFEDIGAVDFTKVSTFRKFADIFIDFVTKRTKLYENRDGSRVLLEEVSDIHARIAKACQKDTEYLKAMSNKGSGEFHYHQPIVIVEGMCMLGILYKKIFS